MHFKKYILLYTLIPILILTVATSYYRFMVLYDYIAAYEGECDPYTESCFVGCEDEDSVFGECNSEYYYTKIQRNAHDLIALCGESIVGCEMASVCTAGEEKCSVTFCDAINHGYCDEIKEESQDYNP